MYLTGIYVLTLGRWVYHRGRRYLGLDEARAACRAMTDDAMGRGAARCVAFALDGSGRVLHERYSFQVPA